MEGENFNTAVIDRSDAPERSQNVEMLTASLRIPLI
jgi:hypothetical protein